MSKAAIIGGGAAGMMAAVLLARRGCEVHLFEKNEKVGKKLYITGKGRCNLTNNCEQSDLLNHVISNPRFMYSAFSAFDAQDVMAFFANEGLDLKTERGNRVFPVSDKSSDVIRTLEKAMKKENVNVHLRTTVKKVVAEDYAPSEEAPEQESRKGGKKAAVGCACGVITEPGGFFPADAVLVASGGLSYPTTGSTGDGYRFAQETGHKVTECEPSLVPLLTAEDYIPEMQGLSLKNTGLTIKSGKKTVYSDFGEMMFTHNGVTGPMILSASAVISKQLKKGPLNAFLDLKPALTPEKLDARILRDFGESPNRQFRNVVSGLLPSSLVPVMIRLSGIPEDAFEQVSIGLRTSSMQTGQIGARRHTSVSCLVKGNRHAAQNLSFPENRQRLSGRIHHEGIFLTWLNNFETAQRNVSFCSFLLILTVHSHPGPFSFCSQYFYQLCLTVNASHCPAG